MRLFGFQKKMDLAEGLAAYRSAPKAVLLDVRTDKEFKEGHLPESKNLPLQELEKIEAVVQDKEIPLFLYCYSGARAGQAVRKLQKMGYKQVQNIGGIAAYKGRVVK